VLTKDERAVVRAVEARAGDLVALVSQLIGFDTVTRVSDEPPRQEATLQDVLARRLRRAGAEVEVWEPRAEEVRGLSLIPAGLTFEGRPQLLARFAGGEGPTLLLNGHIDTAGLEPLDAWASHPLVAEMRDGCVFGRGACDMKGGVAAMVVAMEALAALGYALPGDVLVNTVTDEESTGAGTMATVARGIVADGAIVPEPSSMAVWTACRGVTALTIEVPGRSGHAQLAQPSWRDGGAVNAIDKARLVLNALDRVNTRWTANPALAHPLLAGPRAMPTLIQGGEWVFSYPSACRIDVDVNYLPCQADADGFDSAVREEIEREILATGDDEWLAANPPVMTWWGAVPPYETPANAAVVEAALDAVRDAHGETRVAGMDSWFDAATLSLFAGIPAVAIGPSGGSAHAVDEHVRVDELVACAAGLALVAMRFGHSVSP
jgi:acetylornithine deacetylase